MRPRSAVWFVMLAAAAAPVTAQRAGTLEIGAHARYTRFDRSLGIDDAFGGGGQIGVFIAPGLALEGTGAYLPMSGPFTTTTAGSGSLYPLHARLVYAAPVAPSFALLLGGGYVHNVYGRTGNVSDDGVSGLLGFRLMLSQALGARLEAIEDFIPSPTNQSGAVPNNWNFTVQAGLTALLGSTHPKDADGDGIVDRLDACPGTPPREPVDQRGCTIPRDADADGVVDAVDQCPGTPAGESVDAKGCPPPKDADADGVADNLDKCPNTAAGERVDATGCALDSDRDGVLDSGDRCPGTPAGVTVDATGCPPPKDSDGDGVADPTDRCAGSPLGERVDSIGCPVLFTAGNRTMVLEGVMFTTGSVVLPAQARVTLDRVAESLRAHPGLRVEVAGYTDSRGRAATNLRLSQARADAVRGYLIERGVSPDQLTSRGFGEDDPIDSNATAVGRSRNRRVELHRLN